jgi:predicted outer membrane repeat protein
MFVDNSVVGVTSSTFTSNYCSNTRSAANPKGGAVYVYDGTLNVTNSIFTSNAVTNTGSKGGAIFNDMADVNVASCTFTSNSAGRNGGAIFTNQLTANTNSINSIFTSNSAGKLGGALYLENGNMTTDNCDFSLNSATGLAGAAGGAINHNLGTSTTKNCEIFSNTADVAGGFYLKNGTANIVNTLFSRNSASTYGGAIYVELSTAVLNITNTTIASNSTNEVLTMGGGITSGGGGIANQASTGITLHNTLLWNNTTFGNGAQIANIGSTPIVLDYCSYSNYTNDVYGTLTATNSNTTFPNFVDPSADDYRLGGNSSSADAGKNSYCSEPYDIRGIGFSRFRYKNPGTPPSATIDLGAYEYQLTTDPLLGCTNPTNGGEIASDQSGCVSFDPEVLTNVTLPSGENGTLEYKWQQSTTSATAGFVDIASSTFSTYDPGTVSVNTWFRRLARVSCMDTWLGAIASNAVEMLIYPTSVGGTISGTSPITYGESTGTLTLSGFTGDVLKWQHKYGTAEFGDISGTATSTFTETPVSAGTWTYRAEVQSGVCSSTWSDEFVVTVDKKTLTTSGAIADTKIYDGNTDATITGPVLIGIVSFGGTEDDVDLVQPYTGTFTSEVVGTHSVTASLSLQGDDKNNYILTQPAGLSAEITAKELTVSGAIADDKVYDGNSDAVISGASLVGIENGDDVSLDALTGTFASEIVGTHSVTATLTLQGTDKDNYSLTQPTGLSADITTKELTVSGATADDKVYDGNTDAVISGASLLGIVDGDDVTLDDLTGIFASEIVGTHSVTATLTLSGDDIDNYSLTQPTGLSAEITAKELTVSGATADDKVYDSNTDAIISGAGLVGIVDGDDVTLDDLTGVFASEVVGTHSVTATLTITGNDIDNYSLTQPTGLSAEITAKELTVSGAIADDKVYDGNTDATISGASLNGIVDGDDVTLDDLTGIFESYLVGTHTVTATLTITGTDADNYTLTQPTGLSAEIYPGVPASFTLTGPSSVTAGTDSEDFTIQVYDAFGNPTYCDETTCFSLTTTSNGQNAGFSDQTPCIGVDEGSTTFTYTDSKTGSFTIMATFQSGSEGLEGQFETVTIIVDILPWIHANIGASNGTTEFFPEINAGTFKQTAQGISAPKTDVMNFVYQQLCGTGTVIARLSDVVNGGWAGVMMRESNAPGSKTVLFKTKLYNPNAWIGIRSITNGNISNTSQMVPSIRWMKIQRTSSNTFKIFTSYDGTTWIRRQTATVAMVNCINAGFFTENVLSGRTSSAWFDHAEVVGYLKETDEENGEISNQDLFEVMVYPNPATDQVMITIPENNENVKVTLISASGIVVETSEFNSMDVVYYINHIKPGMYLLRFERDGQIVNKRLIVL